MPLRSIVCCARDMIRMSRPAMHPLAPRSISAFHRPIFLLAFASAWRIDGDGPVAAEGAVNAVDRSCTPRAWPVVLFLGIGLDRSKTLTDRPTENPPCHSSIRQSSTQAHLRLMIHRPHPSGSMSDSRPSALCPSMACHPPSYGEDQLGAHCFVYP